MSFAGKTYLITGGNSGMGFDTAKYLIEKGAKVYITGRNPEAVAKAAATLGHNAVGVVANTASISDSVKLAEEVGANGDLLDGLYINAGTGKFVPIEAVDEALFDEIFNTNVKGAYFTIQKLLPVLRDGSSIVLNGSNATNLGFAGASVYTASKGALNTLARTLSRDLLPRKIRVNVVNPGPIETPIFGKMGIPEAAVKTVVEGITATVPIGRIGQASEITGYVAFLLSDQSTFILGTELTIDGGMSTL